MKRALSGASLSLAAMAARAGTIPFRQDGAGAAASVTGGALGVLLLSLLAIAAVLLVRKRLRLPLPGRAAPPLLQVLETRRLGPRTLLSVVEFAGTRYLLAQGEQGVSCVASAPAAAPGAVPP